MNMLSVFIYAAGVIGNVQGVLIFGAIALGTILALAILASAISNVEPDLVNSAVNINSTKVRKALVWPFIICCLIAALIPDKTTMYMIAASEMGEEVIQTEEFDKVRNLVNNYLDEALNESKKN